MDSQSELPPGSSATGPGRLPRSAPLGRRLSHHGRGVLALVAVIAVLAGADLAFDGRTGGRWQLYPRATSPAPPGVNGPAAMGDQHAVPYPSSASGEFRAASGEGPVYGSGGELRRYRVAVEEGAGVAVGEFAAAVEAVLGDQRSWIGSELLRMQRVADDGADFTIYLATPVTSERMCAAGGLFTEGYTSCRLPGQVIINLARWREAIPDYGAPLSAYRAYVINHEVGHELGEGHESCPGLGRPAPVMQQQTYGLEGCLANAWPYLDGRRYVGTVIP